MSPETLFFLIMTVIAFGGSAVAGYLAFIFFKYSDQVRRGVFPPDKDLHGEDGKSNA